MNKNRRLTTPPPTDWKTAALFFLSMAPWILMFIAVGFIKG